MTATLSKEQLATLDDATLKALGKSPAYKTLVLDIFAMREQAKVAASASTLEAFQTGGTLVVAGYEIPAVLVPFIATSKLAMTSNGDWNNEEQFPLINAIVAEAKDLYQTASVALGEKLYDKTAVNHNGKPTPYEPLRQFTEALL